MEKKKEDSYSWNQTGYCHDTKQNTPTSYCGEPGLKGHEGSAPSCVVGQSKGAILKRQEGGDGNESVREVFLQEVLQLSLEKWKIH